MIMMVAACGGDDHGSQQPPDAAPPQPLACNAFAYCSTYSVHKYIGTVAAPAGGTIADGVYRLAWEIDPDNVNEDPGQDYAEAMLIRGTQFVRGDSGGRGSIVISGSHLTFQSVAHCTGGTDDGPSTDKLDYDYTAAGDQLSLFGQVSRSDGVKWTRQHVWLRVGDVCQTVANQPTDPGDSYMCRVSNCACVTAMNDTVGSCS